MDTSQLIKESEHCWRIEPFGQMRVPAVIYGDEALVADMDDKVFQQVTNVATLPGIQGATYAMPDAHWGYGFPIGGVAAFDPDQGGVISAGGVGFDISCGVRCLLAGLHRDDIEPVKKRVNGDLLRQLFVHRKGATRAWGPGHPDLPPAFLHTGQPVLIGGSMGTASYVLAGTRQGEALSLSSSCHGAGRRLSRHQALKQWSGRQLVDDLAAQGIIIRTPSQRGLAEEAPGAYKDVTAVVDAAHHAGLSHKVARLRPLICIKG